MKTIVIDLDGTLCNSSHRDHLAVARQWDDFHSALGDDTPWPDVKGLIRCMGDDYDIVALTGRNEKHRPATYAWFAKHGIAIDTLLMRPDNCYDSDTIIKPKLLFEHFDDGHRAMTKVLFILEDRDKMVEAWRNLGFRCWQVQPGGY